MVDHSCDTIVAFQACHCRLMLHNDIEDIEDVLRRYVPRHHVIHRRVKFDWLLKYWLNYKLNHLDYELCRKLTPKDEHTLERREER